MGEKEPIKEKFCGYARKIGNKSVGFIIPPAVLEITGIHKNDLICVVIWKEKKKK